MTTNQQPRKTDTMNTTARTENLDDTIRETLIENGFFALEHGSPDQYADALLTERDITVLDYFAARRWDAWRLEPAEDVVTWVTLAAWSEDGIKLMQINRNGVVTNEARLDTTDAGAAWLAKLVA